MLSKRFFKEILLTSRLAAPICAMFLANMLMQIVDTFFVGKLGADALAGLSIGSAVFSVFMIAGLGLLMGLDYLVSKAYGERDLARCRHLLVQGSLLAFAVSLPLIGVMHLAPLGFQRFGLSEVVSTNATEYLLPLSWSLTPFLLTNTFRMYLQGQGNASAAFYVVIAANILNAILNPIFIFGWERFEWSGMGIFGASIATLLGRIFSLLLIVGFAYFHGRQPLREYFVSRGISWHTQRQMLALGLPVAGQMLLEVGVFSGTTFAIGLLSSQELAAHQIVLHVASFTFMIPLGISAAAAVRVGQALGRRHYRRLRQVGTGSLALSFIVMSLCGLLLYFFGDSVIRVFTQDDSVVALGTKLLLVAALFQVSDGFQVTAAGALRGIGDTRASLGANLAGHWMLGFPLGLFLCFGPPALRSVGSWIGLCVGLTSVAVFLTFIWHRKSSQRSALAR